MENINFYPAAYPLPFGNSQGAVIEIVPKTAFDKKSLHFEADVNLAVAKANLTIPINNDLQITLGGKRSYYEFYLTIATNLIPDMPPVAFNTFFRLSLWTFPLLARGIIFYLYPIVYNYFHQP